MSIGRHVYRTALRSPISRPWSRSSGRVVPCWRRGLVSAAELQFGQPVYETHPHLLAAGEVTPGISALEYAERRARLARSLPRNSIAILSAADVKYRSGAVFHAFHQDTDFLYLTGFKEPEALAVIRSGSSEDKDDYEFGMYVRPKDPTAEMWEGTRSGVQAAKDVFNADFAGDIGDIPKALPELLREADNVYTDLPGNKRPQSDSLRYLSGFNASSSAGFPLEVKQNAKRGTRPLRPFLNDLRAKKSDAEIANMRRAGQISGRAYTAAMRQSFSSESELGNFLDHEFKANGCEGSAYIPVIAGGSNALCIHYVRNDQLFARQIERSDLVLVDAGGEYGSYITDITRTWPIHGIFTPPQRELYEAILAVQRTCISLCREDATMTLDEIHAIAEKGLRDNLSQLDFDTRDEYMHALFPHHVGHYVGLDVHDTPGYSRNIPLKSGHCVTIEPGVYVPPSFPGAPPAFHGIGIRIEDSVAVGEENPLILTTEAVKEVADIEALRD